jgi:hypothetical protein
VSEQHLVGVYLNDHLAAATGALELFRRAAGSHPTPRREELARLCSEVQADRDRLRTLMSRLDVGENQAMVAVGWIGERLGRFKPNGYLVSRSPLADVVELEGMRVAVHTKLACWQVLRAVAVHDTRIAKTEIEELIARAEDQEKRLYKLHLQAVQDRVAPTD